MTRTITRKPRSRVRSDKSKPNHVVIGEATPRYTLTLLASADNDGRMKVIDTSIDHERMIRRRDSLNRLGGNARIYTVEGNLPLDAPITEGIEARYDVMVTDPEGVQRIVATALRKLEATAYASGRNAVMYDGTVAQAIPASGTAVCVASE